MIHGLCELHAHLLGSLRPDLLLELAAQGAHDWSWYTDRYRLRYRRPCPLPGLLRQHRAGLDQREAFTGLLRQTEGDWEGFQLHCDLATSAVGWGLPQADGGARLRAVMRRTLQTLHEEAAAQGLGWVEWRLGWPGAWPREQIRTALEDLLAAFAALPGPPQARLVLSLPRAAVLPCWDQVRELLGGPHGAWLVGVDCSGREEAPEDLATFAAALHAHNRQRPERALALLLHVGEQWQDLAPVSAIRRVAVATELGAHRLGHALAAGLDWTGQALPPWESVAERRRQIAWDLAHAPALREAGVHLDEQTLAAENQGLAGRDPHAQLPIPVIDAEDCRRRQDLVLSRLAATSTIVECCPTANRLLTGLEAARHPLSRFLGSGIRTVIGSDDGGILDTDLPRELSLATAWSGRSEEAFTATAWAARSPTLCGRTATADDPA